MFVGNVPPEHETIAIKFRCDGRKLVRCAYRHMDGCGQLILNFLIEHPLNDYISIHFFYWILTSLTDIRKQNHSCTIPISTNLARCRCNSTQRGGGGNPIDLCVEMGMKKIVFKNNYFEAVGESSQTIRCIWSWTSKSLCTPLYPRESTLFTPL